MAVSRVLSSFVHYFVKQKKRTRPAFLSWANGPQGPRHKAQDRRRLERQLGAGTFLSLTFILKGATAPKEAVSLVLTSQTHPSA